MANAIAVTPSNHTCALFITVNSRGTVKADAFSLLIAARQRALQANRPSRVLTAHARQTAIPQ